MIILGSFCHDKMGVAVVVFGLFVYSISKVFLIDTDIEQVKNFKGAGCQDNEEAKYQRGYS